MDTGWRRPIIYLGARQAEGLQPRSQPRATGVGPEEFPRIFAIPFPILSLLFFRSEDVFGCPISKQTSQTFNLAKRGLERGECDQQSVGALVRPLWHAVALGLKPLRLPRAHLQVIFRKRATNHRALLQKMTCEDKASYGSLQPCIIGFEQTVCMYCLYVCMCECV